MKIGNKVTNPGDLNKQIILAKRTITPDAGGFQKPSYGLIAQVWAKWINVHGAEALSASSLGFEAAATVTIRYRSDIDSTCVVVKGGTLAGSTFTGGEVFEIVSPDDIEDRHEYIELKIRKAKAG